MSQSFQAKLDRPPVTCYICGGEATFRTAGSPLQNIPIPPRHYCKDHKPHSAHPFPPPKVTPLWL